MGVAIDFRVLTVTAGCTQFKNLPFAVTDIFLVRCIGVT